MDYGKDFNVVGLNAIGQDEWRFGDDEFTGAGDSTETTHFREFLKCFEAFSIRLIVLAAALGLFAMMYSRAWSRSKRASSVQIIFMSDAR